MHINTNFNQKLALRFVVTLLIALITNGALLAQEIVATSGDSYENATTQVAFTVGQTAINTYESGPSVVTQGFHQSFEDIVSGIEPVADPIAVTVYPNPTSDELVVEVADFNEVINYRLFDFNGLNVTSGLFINKHSLNLVDFADGVYLLLLTNKREELIQSFKIQVE